MEDEKSDRRRREDIKNKGICRDQQTPTHGPSLAIPLFYIVHKIKMAFTFFNSF
jgi:hypothetical protein